jgi:CubicO group peptidase (beta-lactamase class C family)
MSQKITAITSKFLFFLGILILVSSCTGGRMLVYNFSDIKDYKRFPSRDLLPSAKPFHFEQRDGEEFKAKDVRITHHNRHEPIDSLLAMSNTVGFLVIQHDAILYERYFHKYDRQSPVASFSMAKSFTSALVGIALAQGKIGSVEDKMVDYIPELKDKGFENIKIKHLLQMTSGIHHQENYYNPFAGVAKLYYGRKLHRQIRHIGKEMEPGTYFKYKSINTQLLGEIVFRATGRNLSDFMNENLWSKIGMEYPATWSIDQKRDGMEKAFSSINATALDFAKFGRLYLKGGNWEGEQVIPAEWVRKSTELDTDDGAVWYYQYQWWLPSKEGDFMANGHLGQYIYVNPKKDLIIVRLGKNQGKVAWPKAFREIASQL